MAKRSRSAIPEYVGGRFVSVCLGLDYKQAQKALHDAGVRLGAERLYRWLDVEDALGRRFIPYDVIERVAEHVDAGSKSTAPFDVSKEVYDLCHLAWSAHGSVPAGVLRSRPEQKKRRGRPPSAGKRETDKTTELRAQIAEEKRMSAEVQKARLVGQQEQNQLRRLQAQRLQGMMCDRTTVAQKSAEVARTVQRFLSEMPGRVGGYLGQAAAMTDEEIRIVEQMLQAELPLFMRELKKEIEAIERSGVEAASAKRYGERTGSDLAIMPMQ